MLFDASSACSSVIHWPNHQNPAVGLQETVDRASNGDTLCIGPGKHPCEVKLSGKDLTIVSSSGAEATILDGSTGSASCIQLTGTTSATAILGLTFEGGTGTRSGNTRRGGAIVITDGAATIERCIFRGNRAEGGGRSGVGGAIWCTSTRGNSSYQVVIEENLFIANRAALLGGALGFTAGIQPRIINNHFESNHVEFGDGGAIYIDTVDNEAVVDRNEFANNSCGDFGGAIFISGLASNPPASPVQVASNFFAGNTSQSRTQYQRGGDSVAMKSARVKMECNVIADEAGVVHPSDNCEVSVLFHSALQLVDCVVLGASHSGLLVISGESTLEADNSLVWNYCVGGCMVSQALQSPRGMYCGDPRRCSAAVNSLEVCDTSTSSWALPSCVAEYVQECHDCAQHLVRSVSWSHVKARCRN